MGMTVAIHDHFDFVLLKRIFILNDVHSFADTVFSQFVDCLLQVCEKYQQSFDFEKYAAFCELSFRCDL